MCRPNSFFVRVTCHKNCSDHCRCESGRVKFHLWPGQQKGSLEWRRVPTKYLVRRLAQLWRRPDGYSEHITKESRIDKSKMPKCLAFFSSLMTKENTRSKGGLQSFGSAAVDAGRRVDRSHDLFRLTTRAAMVQLRCSAQTGPIYFNTRSILF